MDTGGNATKKRTKLKIISIVLLFVGLCLAAYGGRQISMATLKNRWANVQGEIISSEATDAPVEAVTRTGKNLAYKLTLQYRYAVAGESYTKAHESLFVKEERIVAASQQYPPGKGITVYYKPGDPGVSQIYTPRRVPMGDGDILAVVAGAFVFIVAIFLFVLSRRPVKISMPTFEKLRVPERRIQFEKLLETVLKPDLVQLEGQREQIADKYKKLMTALILLILCILAMVVYLHFSHTRIEILDVPLMVWVVFSTIPICFIGAPFSLMLLAAKDRKAYRDKFKARIIPQLVKHISEEFCYYPDRHIDMETYKKSSLFRQKPEILKGDDLVTGKIGQTEFRFSELETKYTRWVYEYYEDEDDPTAGSIHDKYHRNPMKRLKRKRKESITIFHGIFFVSNFNKSLQHSTFVITESSETDSSLSGSMMEEEKVASTEGLRLEKLENPEFERYFAVFGTDPVECRYVLSTTLMERLVAFHYKTEHPLYISFKENQVYVAIECGRILEPPLFKSVLKPEIFEEYLDDLELAIGIVEDLNLNLRIWRVEDVKQAVTEAAPSISEWMTKGKEFFQAKDYKKAIAVYSKVVDISPDNQAAYFGRGVAYQKAGSTGNAVKDLKTAARLGHPKARALLQKNKISF
jgi:hypothetical protein